MVLWNTVENINSPISYLQIALSTGGWPVQAARAFLGPAPAGYFPPAQASSYLLGK